MVPPTDFDDPNPVTFLSVHGTFCVAVSCDVPGTVGDEWASRVFGMLSDALKEWGIGGKTNSGYGRLERYIEAAKQRTAAISSAAPTSATDEQAAVRTEKQELPRPKYKKGDVISVTREADPNVKKGRAYFKADDGIGGFVQHGELPALEIGKTASLEVSGISDGSYVFSVPGSREASSKEKSKKWRKGGRR
jgi:CRISPR-associated protein Cmr6